MARKKKQVNGDAVIYARYSSHNQRDVSIEQQIEACRKHAARMGLTVTATYEDRAISGKTDKRPAFQQMMNDAENGNFGYVLAWKSNRMGRNMMQAMINETRLMDCGVKVCYAEEDFDDSAAGRFALRNMMNVNQFYSDNLAEDVRRGMMDNARKCMANGRQPLGYKRGPDGKVVIDEPAAAIVREIYQRVANYEPYMDIARDLNLRGIKTAGKGEWNKCSFHGLCSNERYRGIYVYNDVRIEGGIPRIIDDHLWFQVQEAVKMKKNTVNGRYRAGSADYLLTGKLRCGNCGSYMIGMSGTSASGDIHNYYACQKRRADHSCNKRHVRQDVIELAVAQAIKIYCLTDEVIEWIADKTVAYWEDYDRSLQINVIENELAATQNAVDNIMKAIEAGIITDSTKSQLMKLDSEKRELSSKLAAAKADLVHVDRNRLIASLLLYRNGDVQDKKFQADLFTTFLSVVYLYDDNRLKLVFNFWGDKNPVEIPLDIGEENNDNSSFYNEKMFAKNLKLSTKKNQPNMFGWFFFLFVSPMNRSAPLSRFTASVQKPQIETAEHFILWFCETLFKQQNQDRPVNVSPFWRGGIAKQ